MVRSVGVASAAAALALGVAGTASACNIADFSASISCDQPSGQGKIVVADTDSTRPVTLTVKTDDGTQVVAPQTFNKGDDLVVTVPWTSGTHYDVFASVANRFSDQKITKGSTTVSSETCGEVAPTTPPATTPPVTETPTATPSETVAPTASPTTSAPAQVADTSSPSPSPSGNLAETGGGSNTGTIAGIAGALVVVGGGAVFMLRRRTASARH